MGMLRRTTPARSMRPWLAGRLAVLALLLPGAAWAQPPAEVVEYYHTDALGSVRAVTDQSGALVRWHDYFPFGEEYLVQAGADNRRFTGKERDTETGLDYFGARYYASRRGRFTSVDPVLDVETALFDPRRWNRYSYALNRPLVMIDPDGREAGYIYLPGGQMRAPVRGLTRRGMIAVAVLSAAVAAIEAAPVAIRVGATCLFTPSCNQAITRTVESTAPGTSPSPPGMAGPRTPSVGAVIGHYEAGYAKAGRELGVAVLDIPMGIWSRMSPDQRQKANQAFLDGIIEKRLTIQVVTDGFVRPRSTLRWEIDYLLGRGYTFSKSGEMLLPPK
jgi:RHS repeat-associated protein